MSEQDMNQKYIKQNSIVKEIARDPFAADLLFTLFSSAVGTMYQDPRVPIPKEKTLEEIVQSMPPMQQLVSYSNDTELIQVIGSESADVLRCAILECPSSYALLPESLEIPEFKKQTPGDDNKKCYQFIAIQSPPEKEEMFQFIKSKVNGSMFAFHGSEPKCWNKINREELKNLTGTKFMLHGSAYGEGIGLTLNSDTAIQYSLETPNQYPNSQLGKNISIVALCEVANLPNREMVSFDFDSVANGNHQTCTLKGQIRKNDWNYMLTLEEACIIRYLFVNFDTKIDFEKSPIPKIPTIEDLKK